MFVSYSTLASFSALVAGTLFSSLAMQNMRRTSRQKALKQSWQGQTLGQEYADQGLSQLVIASIVRTDVRMRHAGHSSAVFMTGGSGTSALQKRLMLAGLEDVSVDAAAALRLRLALGGGAAGCICGLVLTPAAALLFCIAGALAGWASVPWALGEAVKLRTRSVERRISEAIEVICLGLRAGLSFDRSLELYWGSFPGGLGHEFALAQQTWQTGLMTREDALRRLAQRYDSQVFQRVIDSIVRSLRFGSPLANSLEDLAQEARRIHRSKVEETVMKAPVKMMLPIGVLILPSMLLLVMGPIMLELFTGF